MVIEPVILKLRTIYYEAEKRKLRIYKIQLDRKSFEIFKNICFTTCRFMVIPENTTFYFNGIKIVGENL